MKAPQVTLGVDCGKTGALAFLDADGALIDVVDMPDAMGFALGALVRDILVTYRPTVAWVERTQAFPGQGSTSAHDYGRDAGAVLGAIGSWDVAGHLVTPTSWKSTMGLAKKPGESKAKHKARSRALAVSLWPSHSTMFARAKDDGRAEAALIARYGWQRTAAGGAGS